MDDSDINKTVVIDSDESSFISLKLAAVNNKVRFSILEILRDNQKYNKNPLYSRELNSILLNI